jgi:adenosine deaminase CECR1
MRRAVLAVLLSLLAGASAMAALPPADTDTAAWFERFKAEATDEELYRFLYAMPKGGDLHNHLSGSILSEWFYDLALQQAERGYRYYTRVRIENCRPYGGNAFVESPYLLMFVTIQESTFQALDACEQSEYRPLEALDAAQKAGMAGQPAPGKTLGGSRRVLRDPLAAHGRPVPEPLPRRRCAAEEHAGVCGRRPDVPREHDRRAGFHRRRGADIAPDAVADIYRAALATEAALATGVTVRLQVAILRFPAGCGAAPALSL